MRFALKQTLPYVSFCMRVYNAYYKLINKFTETIQEYLYNLYNILLSAFSPSTPHLEDITVTIITDYYIIDCIIYNERKTLLLCEKNCDIVGIY